MSWLLTKDHKRIGLLYLISVFRVLSCWAPSSRPHPPRADDAGGDLVESDVYNKIFTMHGVIMVFFF